MSSILDGLYPGADDKRPLLRTFSWWDRAVSDRIAAKARPVKLYRGTLIVHTCSAAWAQELSFHERDLLASVRAHVPQVQRVRIRVGPFPAPLPRLEKPKPAYLPLPVASLPADVARALAHVADDSLRDALTRAACTSLSNRRRDEGDDR